MALTSITTGMEKGPEAIDANFKALEQLAAVQKATTHTDGITLVNGATSSDAHYTVAVFGKLKIVHFDGGFKGIDIRGSGATGFAKIPASVVSGTFLSTMGTVHHNGMGGYVDVSVNTQTGDLTVTAIAASGGDGIHNDLVWSGSCSVLLEVD